MEIRKLQYSLPNDGIMILKVGQWLRHNDTQFQISHFKKISQQGNYIVQVFVRLDGETASYPWKDVVNGTCVVEYDLKFLNQMV